MIGWQPMTYGVLFCFFAAMTSPALREFPEDIDCVAQY
jgi:hypothetical protein